MKKVLIYISYFVLGNMIFNLIFSASKTAYINHLGGHEGFFESWRASFGETILFYAVIFAIIVIADIVYKKYLINQLNEKLDKIQGRSGEDEK